jgi:hypothetical protein
VGQALSPANRALCSGTFRGSFLAAQHRSGQAQKR